MGFILRHILFCQIAAIPLWFKLSRRIGKHRGHHGRDRLVCLLGVLIAP